MVFMHSLCKPFDSVLVLSLFNVVPDTLSYLSSL